MSLPHRDFESVAEAAKRLGISTRTVNRYLADRLIRAYKVGPHLVRLDPDEVDAALLRPARPVPRPDAAT